MLTPRLVAEREAFGDTKLDALLDYLEAQTCGPLPGKLPVALGKVRIPIEQSGVKKFVTIGEATREQMKWTPFFGPPPPLEIGTAP